MNKLYLIQILLFFFIASCENKQQEKVRPVSFVFTKQPLATGKWHYNNTIWYSSELTLDGSGKFSFHDQNCLGQTFTEGNWFQDGENVFLLSSDTYKPSKQNGNALFSPRDTIKVFFDNERLQFKNNALLGQNKILEGCRFLKTTNDFFNPVSY